MEAIDDSILGGNPIEIYLQLVNIPELNSIYVTETYTFTMTVIPCQVTSVTYQVYDINYVILSNENKYTVTFT